MSLEDAIALIQPAPLSTGKPQTWLDLGAGSGLFTRALATLLSPGSKIYAIDQVIKQQDYPPGGRVTIEPVQADFVSTPWPSSPVDGILMANALHYVQQQAAFVQKMVAETVAGGSLLVVEYDTDIPVPHWVPYPVSKKRLQYLINQAGKDAFEVLAEKPSVYGHAPLYAAWAGV